MALEILAYAGLSLFKSPGEKVLVFASSRLVRFSRNLRFFYGLLHRTHPNEKRSLEEPLLLVVAVFEAKQKIRGDL